MFKSLYGKSLYDVVKNSVLAIVDAGGTSTPSTGGGAESFTVIPSPYGTSMFLGLTKWGTATGYLRSGDKILGITQYDKDAATGTLSNPINHFGSDLLWILGADRLVVEDLMPSIVSTAPVETVPGSGQYNVAVTFSTLPTGLAVNWEFIWLTDSATGRCDWGRVTDVTGNTATVECFDDLATATDKAAKIKAMCRVSGVVSSVPFDFSTKTFVIHGESSVPMPDVRVTKVP